MPFIPVNPSPDHDLNTGWRELSAGQPNSLCGLLIMVLAH